MNIIMISMKWNYFLEQKANCLFSKKGENEMLSVV